MKPDLHFLRDSERFAPVVAFEAESTELDHYTFVPWVRSGLGTMISGAPVGIRAQVNPGVTVSSPGEEEIVRPEKPMVLHGPGDVIGIDPAQIIRRYPSPGAFDADPNYLAHIEFDRPDFPWLFTPLATSGDRLESWLALIVIETAEAPRPGRSPSLPSFVDVAKRELQPLQERWAWAHAQVAGRPGVGASVSDRLTDDYAPTNLSRLMCPRRLEDQRTYLACVVPAYECGVNAGLGRSGGGLGPAWTRMPGDDADIIRLPVYACWQFATGRAEWNFEKLAKKLQGIVAPWQLGRRLIDAAEPRGGIEVTDGEGGLQLLECAVKSPSPIPAETAQTLGLWSTATREKLRGRLNASAPADPTAPPPDLPYVNPAIYAQFQRGQRTVAKVGDDDWFEQLNTVPVNRVIAGLGTRVVQKDQEQLLQAAWAQVGQLEPANRLLARSQFARYAAAALHRKHISRLELGPLAQITRALHGKIKFDGEAFTVAGMAARSITAPAVLNGAFRRITRMRGPVARIAGRSRPQGEVELGIERLVVRGNAFRDCRVVYREPEGIEGLSPRAIERFPREVIGQVLAVGPDEAVQVLTEKLRPLQMLPTSADLVQRPVAEWKVRSGELDIGALGAARLFAHVQAALPARHEADIARSESLARTLVAVGDSRMGEVSSRARTIARSIGQRLGPVAEPGLWQTDVSSDVAVSGPLAGIERNVSVNRMRGRTASLSIRERVNTGSAIRIATRLGAVRATPIALTAERFQELLAPGRVITIPTVQGGSQFGLSRAALLAKLEPSVTVSSYVRGRLGKLPAWLAGDWFDDGRIQPIIAAPVFVRAMYEALDAYDREWLIPGLGAAAESDFVTVLESNPHFIEAFLIGLSDEFGRELLWRHYPNDGRGTYFRRFWDAGADELAEDIHAFARDSVIGSHMKGGTEGIAVVLIRGELIKHYPNAIVLAVSADPDQTRPDGSPIFAPPPAPFSSEPGSVLFHAALRPDMVLVGFRLSIEELRRQDEPWWILVAEHPSAPRFGLDSGDAPQGPVTRNDLTWSSLLGPASRYLTTSEKSLAVAEPGDGEQTNWGGSDLTSGGVARVLLQNPFRAAWQAWKLLPGGG
ncbi:hypothetical protein [Ensifer aridi]|uniref:hypothetical protein n=1 Tax=Ensifer aridi TaxID=1708715 RepID=UPI000A1081CB|nr:hypothetical protein [Ensifer aridi]